MRRKENLIGGVCGGIAHHYDFDPTMVRFITLMAFFAWGSPIFLLYCVMWIIMPE